MLIAIEVVIGTEGLIRIDSRFVGAREGHRRQSQLVTIFIRLAIRMVLLVAAVWILGAATPIFSAAGTEVSPRSLLLLGGGLFLVVRASLEIHRRLTATKHDADADRGASATLSPSVAQSVKVGVVHAFGGTVVAVGMVEQLTVMVLAVVLATGVSTAARTPILAYLTRRPTVSILCFAMLVVVGFNLLLEGLGYHLPKAHLYTVIGVALLVEGIGQFRDRDPDGEFAGLNIRQRTARRMLKLLGRQRGRSGSASSPIEPVQAEPDELGGATFAKEEADMIQSVLTLAERPVRTIMSPRPDVQWVDIDGTADRVRSDILRLTHPLVLLCRGRLNDFVGVAATTDLLRAVVKGSEAELWQSMRPPIVVHEGTKVLKLIEELRSSSIPLAVVLDEYGTLAGIATPTDILEAIAGKFSDRREASDGILSGADGSWTFDGSIDVHRVSAVLEVDLVDAVHRYTTLNGYIASRLGEIPRAGQSFVLDGLGMEIVAMKGRTVDRVRVRRQFAEDPGLLQQTIS